MKKLRYLCLVFVVFVSHTVFSQDTIRNYITSECLSFIVAPSEWYVIDYSADSLIISGITGASCTGTHFAMVSVKQDTIFVKTQDAGVQDTGELVDCRCMYTFSIKIKRPSLAENVIYFDDSLIYYNQAGIINKIEEKSIKIFPNPFNETTTIDFLNTNSDCFTFKMFDCYGRLIKTLNGLNTSPIQLYRDNLHSGVYYFHLFSDKSHYFGELLIR
jgi:hypothetical protein